MSSIAYSITIKLLLFGITTKLLLTLCFTLFALHAHSFYRKPKDAVPSCKHGPITPRGLYFFVKHTEYEDRKINESLPSFFMKFQQKQFSFCLHPILLGCQKQIIWLVTAHIQYGDKFLQYTGIFHLY